MKQAGEFIQQQVARDSQRRNAFIATRYKGATTPLNRICESLCERVNSADRKRF